MESEVIIWTRLAVIILIFAASCIGLGYVTGLWALRRKHPQLISGLMAVAIACFWPVTTVVYVIYTGRRYLEQHPHDDAPAMVLYSLITVGVPILFVTSLGLAIVGLLIARRRIGRIGND